MKETRVGLFCRVLPKYRLAIYEQLAKRPGIDLTVLYSKEPPWYSLKTVDPGTKFRSRLIDMKALRYGKGNREVLYQPDAWRMVRGGHYDVVVLPGNPRLLSNFTALLAARRNRVGVVWWTLGLMADQSPWTLAVRKFLMKLPNSVVVYTSDERDYFVSHGINSEKVFVAQNTIDTAAERTAVKHWDNGHRDDLVVSHGLEGKRVILYCARLAHIKRVDLLLRSMKVLLSRDANYHVIIVGGGECETELKSLAATLNVEEHITWTGPIYDPDKLAPWYLVSKALVIPSAIGLAALQGFAYGLPCITTQCKTKQSPEASALRDDYNCLLYRDGSVEDLSDRIERIVTDDDLQIRLSGNAVRTVCEEYTVDRMVDGFCDAINYAKEQVSR